jgi:hypothetical protein
MKKLKHVKLFESFVNEELSPNLKKRTYDAMMKIAKDPNSIDNIKRGLQASNIMKSLSPEVEKLRNQLEAYSKIVFPNAKPTDVKVNIYNNSLESGFLDLYVMIGTTPFLNILISKDKYQKGKSLGEPTDRLYSDRPFVNTLKKLIVQIQKDEIPEGESPNEIFTKEPKSITKEGEIRLNPHPSYEEDERQNYLTNIK